MSDLPEEIISTPEQLAACCAHLAGHPHFGFDTEFVGEDTYHPRLCLIQAAAPDRLFIIDPLSTGPLDAFWRLVVDPDRVVVVHAGREEVRLCRHGAGKTPGNLFDLQIAAGLVGMTYPLGHGPLVGQVLGVHLSKGETRTEWRDRPLTPEQIRYAFDDVRFLLRTWEKLSGRLEKLGRTPWAREEFARLAQTASPEEPATEEKWRKLRGIGSLDRFIGAKKPPRAPTAPRGPSCATIWSWRSLAAIRPRSATSRRCAACRGATSPPSYKRSFRLVNCRWKSARPQWSATRIRRKCC